MEDIIIEPKVARRAKASSDPFNPNVPGHCTQEEFIAHIREIEAGNFTPWEEAKKEFAAWKKGFLASRLK